MRNLTVGAGTAVLLANSLSLFRTLALWESFVAALFIHRPKALKRVFQKKLTVEITVSKFLASHSFR